MLTSIHHVELLSMVLTWCHQQVTFGSGGIAITTWQHKKKPHMLQALLNLFRQQYPTQGLASIFCTWAESRIRPWIRGTCNHVRFHNCGTCGISHYVYFHECGIRGTRNHESAWLAIMRVFTIAGFAGSLITCVFTNAGSAGCAIICVFTTAGPHPVINGCVPNGGFRV